MVLYAGPPMKPPTKLKRAVPVGRIRSVLQHIHYPHRRQVPQDGVAVGQQSDKSITRFSVRSSRLVRQIQRSPLIDWGGRAAISVAGTSSRRVALTSMPKVLNQNIRGEQERKRTAANKMPAAGPHARKELTNLHNTPGACALPPIDGEPEDSAATS
jgi:hypothetical protein